MSTESTDNDDDFQKEIVELFSQEAQDWLVQIDAALTELEGHAAPDRHTQLVDAIVRAITSLGGSAATINLSEVERATFALLPFIDLVRDRTTTTPQDFTTIRQQFAVVKHAVCDATGSPLSDGPPLEKAGAADGWDVLTQLNALRSLETTDDRTRPSAGHLTARVIARLEQEAAQGRTSLDPGLITHMLGEFTRADDELLQDLHQTLPEVRHALEQLQRTVGNGAAPDLTPVLHDVERLQSRAELVNAVPIVTFLGGLSRLLSLIVRRRVAITSTKLEAVGARLTTLLAMTEEWVERGRQERSAIASLLPAAQ